MILATAAATSSVWFVVCADAI